MFVKATLVNAKYTFSVRDAMQSQLERQAKKRFE